MNHAVNWVVLIDWLRLVPWFALCGAGAWRLVKAVRARHLDDLLAAGCGLVAAGVMSWYGAWQLLS